MKLTIIQAAPTADSVATMTMTMLAVRISDMVFGDDKGLPLASVASSET